MYDHGKLLMSGRPVRHRAVRAGLALAAGFLSVAVLPGAPAVAATDLTGAIRANQNVVLAGDSVVNLSGTETLTYGGVISGEGTLTVAGTGRLILVKDSDFRLPAALRRQQVTTGSSGDSYSVTTVSNPDPPAVIVNRGATLQYGDGKSATGVVGHYQYQTPGFQLNADNIRVDGTLDVAVTRKINLGTISGSGFILQRRFTWGGIHLSGSQPFTGVIYNGTGVDLGSPYSLLSLTGVKKFVNQGSAIVGVPSGQRLVLGQDFYSREYGNDINFNFPLSKRALAVMTGVYSWADAGADSDPSLSNPALNFNLAPHKNNKRGINIEGSNVQWGDGTHSRFFLPGNKDTVYINLHTHRDVRGRLTFNYNGPVTLFAPISGGRYHDTLAAPGAGDIVIAPTPGNAVTFAAPQNYDGSTTIGAGATLRLGTGKAGEDGSLLVGTARRAILVEGTLIVQNASTAISLSHVSGPGGLTQAGPATVTLTGETTYTGATTISAGTIAVTSGSLSSSGRVDLTAAGTTLDLSRATDRTLRQLHGMAATTVAAGNAPLTVESGAFAGNVTGAGVTKAGPGTLALTGQDQAVGDTLTVQAGQLRLASSAQVGDYAQSAGASLAVVPGASIKAGGTVRLAGRLELDPATTGTPGEFRLIDNGGAGPVSGTFADLPEGARVSAGYRISYTGGDGNDVVLTPTGDGPAFTLHAASGTTGWIVPVAGAIGLLVVAAGVVLWTVVRRRKRRATQYDDGPHARGGRPV